MNWFKKKVVEPIVLSVGGYIKTDLLDVDYIKANFINAEYIEALEVNLVQGTIGGIEINAGSITAPKFSLTAAGSIEAVDADLSNITVDGIICENAYIDGLEVINATIEDVVITNATIDNVTITDATITGSFTSTSANASINDSGISFNDGSGGSVEMSAGSSGIGLVATDGTDTMVFAAAGIYMSVGGSFYEGYTGTKVAGGVTFQFVNGVLVL